ncbi:LamG domain-containing protein [bacterium]|nr:LamG domain-containing protein [bacterium]
MYHINKKLNLSLLVSFSVLFLLSVFNFTSSATAEEGLVAYWNFDEGKGSVLHDLSGNKNHGTIVNASWARTEDGHALKFGESDTHYVNCGENPSLNITGDMTIMAWVKLMPSTFPNPKTNWTILSCEKYKKSGFILRIDGRTAKLFFRPGYDGDPLYVYSEMYLKANIFYHLSIVRNGKNITYFIDGIPDTQFEVPNPAPAEIPLTISNESQPFEGLIDNMKIYNRALSEDEIVNQYRQEAKSRGKTVFLVEKAERETGTSFFKQDKKQIDFHATEKQLHFANQYIGIEFFKVGDTYRLSRFYGIEHDIDFLTLTFGGHPFNLWEAILRADNGRDKAEKRIGVTDARTSSYHIDKNEVQSTLQVTWGGIDLPDKKAAIEVCISVTLKRDDPLSYWRIDVRNNSKKWGVWQVYFPTLSLAPIGEKHKDNVFVFPKDRGRVVENCFETQSGYGHGLNADYEEPPTGPGQSVPGDMDMQFQALYNAENGAGLYLAAYDGEGYMKHLRVVNRKTNLLYLIAHDPDNMGYPKENYSMSYDFVIGPFTGNWYDACQIYRQWAIKQSWCSKGPLIERNDIPKWFKEAPMMLCAQTYGKDDNIANVHDAFLAFLDIAKVPLPCVWYGWKFYQTKLTAYDKLDSPWRVSAKNPYPPGNVHDGNYPKLPALPGFSEACKSIREAGGYPSPYVCLQIYDQGQAENAPYVKDARPYVSRHIDGKLRNYPREPSWLMCAFTKWWQERLKETCVELIRREHAGGAYLDTMHGAAHWCFATEHGHSYGGGTYRSKGMHEISRICRDAMKAVDPNTFTTGENPNEIMIDVIDGILYQYTVRADFSAPLFATVYQDYITRHGMGCRVEAGEGFYMQAGSLFVEGAQIGRLRIGGGTKHLDVREEKYGEQLAYLKRLIGYYRQDMAKKFLCYGRLLRPLKFSQPSQMPVMSYKEPRGYTYRAGIVKLPALQSGVFQAPDGELGVFIVNMSPKEVSFTTALDFIEYGLPDSKIFNVQSITSEGKKKLEYSNIKQKLILQGILNPRDVIMYRIGEKLQ